MTRPERLNYIQVHRGQIEAIKSATTQVIDMMDPFVAIKEGSSTSLEVNDQPTPISVYEFYLNQGLEIADDEAHNYAIRRNRLLRSQAEIAILGLQASATLLFLSEQTNSDRHNTDDNLLVEYGLAKHAAIEAYSVDNEYVQLSYTLLERLNGDNTASVHEITVNNGMFVEALVISSLNAVVQNIKYDVRAMGGEFLNQCINILGKTHATELLSVFSKTITETEIDSILGSIWSECRLRYNYNPEEVEPLLNEIKRRASLIQHVRELNGYGDDANLPNKTRLNKYGRLVGLK